MNSTLVFRARDGLYSIYMCACGCDVQVKVGCYQESQVSGPPRFYARHHQPLACDPYRISETWDGILDVIFANEEENGKDSFPDEDITPVIWESWQDFDTNPT
jgi:hypothetical protein